MVVNSLAQQVACRFQIIHIARVIIEEAVITTGPQPVTALGSGATRKDREDDLRRNVGSPIEFDFGICLSRIDQGDTLTEDRGDDRMADFMAKSERPGCIDRTARPGRARRGQLAGTIREPNLQPGAVNRRRHASTSQETSVDKIHTASSRFMLETIFLSSPWYSGIKLNFSKACCANFSLAIRFS